MKKLQIVIIEFLVSFSICAFASVQAMGLTFTYSASMPLTSAKGLNLR